MRELDYIINKYNLTLGSRYPAEIPNVNRDDLAALFHELGYKTGVEVGVERGLYSAVLCLRNPGLHLYCVDAWAKYPGYRDHVSQGKLDGFYEQTAERLAIFGCTLIRKYSVDAAADFKNRSLDFVYIDANHEYLQVVQDISAWAPKVRRGGIVSGHDFIRRKDNNYQCHVVEAVTGYVTAYHIAPWFVMGRKHAQPPEKRDKPRSWFYVKE